MLFTPRDVWPLLKDTAAEISADDVPSLSAAIAYYTLFSLPPLLVILIAVAGVWLGPDTVQEALTGQVNGLAGAAAADQIRTMITSAGDLGEGVGSKLVGIVVLLLGASGAFGELQKALNRAWDIDEEAEDGFRAIVLKRLLSFGMVLTIAFLLLVSLVLSTGLSAVSHRVGDVLPGGVSSTFWHAIDLVLSLGVVTVLFATLFVVLPDATIAWRDVWVGAAVTALLFTLGKWSIGFYLGTANPGSAFGAAGALALLLVWIYYSALILLVGAEFTQVWALRCGTRIAPDHEASPAAEAPVHPLAQPRDPEPY